MRSDHENLEGVSTSGKRWLAKWGGVTFVALIAAALLLPWLVLAIVKPSLRDIAIGRLAERFDDVRLDELELRPAAGWSLVPKLAASGAGLSVSLPGHKDAPPFIKMRHFTVELDILGLFRSPIRIRSLELEQLEIQIPPGDDDDSGNEDDESADSAPPAFLIERLEADGTILRILSKDPDGEPLEFKLHELQVDSAGLGEPMAFEAMLDNPKPPGWVRTKGAFGPLDLDDVGSSPVSGEYVFERAKLSEFGGIGGTLYSEGTFGGVLSRLEASGFTETPDFQLSSASHPISLTTEFEATIDGTNGDTFLTPVHAVLGESPIQTQGGVFNLRGTDGKVVCLDALGEDGRIEDFLHLAMGAETPLMTGDIRFQSLILIPSREAPVIEKLVLDGEFLIDAARFPESGIQEKVDDLSEAGRGVTNDDSAGAVAVLRDERTFSGIRGEFELRDSVMTISGLSFTVPGASVGLEGTYGLSSKEIDFRGELRLDAKLSETTDGFKSFLLKLVDPLFEKDDAGSVVPIKITGTADNPSFGPDLGRVLSREEVTDNPKHGHRQFRKTLDTCDDLLTGSKLTEILKADSG